MIKSHLLYETYCVFVTFGYSSSLIKNIVKKREIVLCSYRTKIIINKLQLSWRTHCHNWLLTGHFICCALPPSSLPSDLSIYCSFVHCSPAHVGSMSNYHKSIAIIFKDTKSWIIIVLWWLVRTLLWCVPELKICECFELIQRKVIKNLHAIKSI